MAINSVKIDQAWSWVRCGWKEVRRDQALWFSMALMYLVLGMVLFLIPFIGRLILVLLSPMLLAGPLMIAHINAPGQRGRPAPKPPGDYAPPASQQAQDTVRRAFNQLLAAFNDQDRLLPIIIVSTLMLATVVIIQILEILLKIDGPALRAMFAGSIGPSVWLPALLALAVVLGLKLVAAMGMMYAVPLMLFRDASPVTAIEDSVTAASHNLWPTVAYLLGFLGLSVALELVYWIQPLLGYLLLLVVGMVAVPVFVAGLYCAYRDNFD